MIKINKDEKEIKLLVNCCNWNEIKGNYESKRGEDLLEAINSNFKAKNKNDKPFLEKDLLLQPTKETFEFEGINDFQYVCDLVATPLEISADKKMKINEKIIPKNFQSNDLLKIFNESLGVVYLITFLKENNEYFVKIGQTRTTFKDRLSSYNCGTLSAWRTASTTNIKILQSFVATRGTFKLYLCYLNDEKSYEWYGEKSKSFASSKSIAYEDIFIKKFIQQYNQKPLANVQANATGNKNI